MQMHNILFRGRESDVHFCSILLSLKTVYWDALILMFLKVVRAIFSNYVVIVKLLLVPKVQSHNY